jgi:hypothetical protein
MFVSEKRIPNLLSQGVADYRNGESGSRRLPVLVSQGVAIENILILLQFSEF